MSPIYRTFTLFPEGGDPLAVARAYQGGGRHDNPDVYPALYGSRRPEAAVAEALRRFRGRTPRGRPLERADGGRLALATIDDRALDALIDLDDPSELTARSLRPSSVATRERDVTQPIALRLYEEGADGFEWWSTVEASWINVTLFADRAGRRLSIADPPHVLSWDDQVVRAAAEAVGLGESVGYSPRK
ncbi:MAG TPA: RES family NAD+ phosphorylase [Actinomycetota bacterium]|nr:RES family NAD+ phosphorylase [Actinomycetota bacterium]